MTDHERAERDARSRRALFERLVADSGLAQHAGALIPRRTSEAPAPLSFAQRRLWFLDQLEPGHAVYNVPGVLRIGGAVDAEALATAVARIVERHEVLRTTFGEVAGEPVQIVGRARRVAIERFDLSTLSGDGLDAAVLEKIRAEAARPFDLAVGPLFRVVLVRLSDHDYLVLFTLHHIVADEWSLGLLARELGAFYGEVVGVGSADLAPLAVQYADYAVWQHEWGRSAASEQQLAWWRDHLRDLTPLDMLTDRPRPAALSYRGATRAFRLSSAERASIEALGRRAGATPFMTLLAIFQVLLYRYTRRQDIAIGTPVANRRQAELQHLIGFFTNTLVMRTSVDGRSSCLGHLARVRASCLEAYAHQEVPFEAIVEALQPPRDLNHHPFFDVLFVLQTRLPTFAVPGLEVSFAEQEITTSKFDLTLTLREENDGWNGWVEYATDLFDPATIDRFGKHFCTTAAAVCASPETSIDDLPLLTPDEQRLVIEGFNDTVRPYEGDRLVHRLFEEQARKTPSALALVAGAERLTYGELDRHANRLARRLLDAGVGPEVPVALCLERSADMVMAVLAVLKAGGAYVPLDPAYPRDRLRFMLHDSGVRVLVLHEATRQTLPSSGVPETIDLDADEAVIAANPDAPITSSVAPENLLYFMYTSGSTGRPKGTTLSHAALYNLIRWHLETLLVGVPTLQFASLSFDASFHEMFAALASGGALHLISETDRRDLDALVSYLARERVAKVILPVALFQQLAAAYAGRTAPLAHLREITTTGEQLLLTPAIVSLMREMPACALHNHYGPSETHVVTAFTIGGLPAEIAPPPIGRPIANTQIYLLDRRLAAVPIGVPGELFIGGASLARDYHDRPELTSERFVPNPFARTAGERLYRTGDLARYLPDGNIEYLGRLDDQVKIRGFRVEPGEVETVLCRHPGIDQAVVVVKEVVTGQRALVGYVVWKDGCREPWESVRRFLSAHLPDYLVPSFFTALDSLPLTPSGKVARRLLPMPDRSLAAAYLAPTTVAERWMAGLWQELLGVARVGVGDNFFDLGGHSLMATRLVSRIRQALPVDVHVRMLFERPTLGGLVEALGERAGGRDRLEMIVETVQQVDGLSDEQTAALLVDLERLDTL